jgi:MFS family permease
MRNQVPNFIRRIHRPEFYGWIVVRAAFLIAIFGWGVGFYGPAVYMKAVQDAHGWSLGLVSAAVTWHFLIGAVAVANLPCAHRRFGLPKVTFAGALALALGVVGWSLCQNPWQLFLAATLSGVGWVALGAVAINTMVSPWFATKRPAALALAYNGASMGGVIFSPLWVALIAAQGFAWAAIGVGMVMVLLLGWLARHVLVQTPADKGVQADGVALPPHATEGPRGPTAPLLAPTARLGRPWRDAAFITLALGTALGLFAQIGLISHLYSLLTPALGAQTAGFAAGLATASAIVGRTLVGWLLRPGADRRRVAAANYMVQVAGCGCLALGALLPVPVSTPWLIAGVVLFGFGIGNATSLPPLIAQVEFYGQDMSRVVAWVTAVSQGTYAFAPLFFGLIRGAFESDQPGISPALFALAASIQVLAAWCYLAGRGKFLRRA